MVVTFGVLFHLKKYWTSVVSIRYHNFQRYQMKKSKQRNLFNQSVLITITNNDEKTCVYGSNTHPLPGDTCLKCKMGQLEYNGLLNLACSVCGNSFGGSFT